MKLFLLHFFKFFGILIVISLCGFKAIDCLNAMRFEKYIGSLRQEAIFVGDSHIQSAINDALIANVVNLSQNGEPYYFTYYKLKKIVASKKTKIKTIYLGFGYHNLSSYRDDFTFGKYNHDISARYFFILPTSEREKFIGYNKSNMPLYFKKIVENGLVNIFRKKEKFSFLGYYQNGFVNMASQKKSMNKRLERQFYNDTTVADFSKINILCESRVKRLSLKKRKRFCQRYESTVLLQTLLY